MICWIRHPPYTVASVFAVSLAVLTSMWWLAPDLILPLAVLLLRTRREEANLVQEFGDEYRAYQARTCRFTPLIY